MPGGPSAPIQPVFREQLKSQGRESLGSVRDLGEHGSPRHPLAGPLPFSQYRIASADGDSGWFQWSQLMGQQRGYLAAALPQLDIVPNEQPLRGGNGRIIVVADQGLDAQNMAVTANDVGPVFRHDEMSSELPRRQHTMRRLGGQ